MKDDVGILILILYACWLVLLIGGGMALGLRQENKKRMEEKAN